MPSGIHITALRVQIPYTLETHDTTITCTVGRKDRTDPIVAVLQFCKTFAGSYLILVIYRLKICLYMYTAYYTPAPSWDSFLTLQDNLHGIECYTEIMWAASFMCGI